MPPVAGVRAAPADGPDSDNLRLPFHHCSMVKGTRTMAAARVRLRSGHHAGRMAGMADSRGGRADADAHPLLQKEPNNGAGKLWGGADGC